MKLGRSSVSEATSEAPPGTGELAVVTLDTHARMRSDRSVLQGSVRTQKKKSEFRKTNTTGEQTMTRV